MRSLKLALLATAATAVLSSAAFAADLVVDTPTVPPAELQGSMMPATPAGVVG